MNRIINFFRAKSFAILLFSVGLLFFSWPLLSLPIENKNLNIFSYIFISWAVVVALLIVVSRSISIGEDMDEKD